MVQLKVTTKELAKKKQMHGMSSSRLIRRRRRNKKKTGSVLSAQTPGTLIALSEDDERPEIGLAFWRLYDNELWYLMEVAGHPPNKDTLHAYSVCDNGSVDASKKSVTWMQDVKAENVRRAEDVQKDGVGRGCTWQWKPQAEENQESRQEEEVLCAVTDATEVDAEFKELAETWPLWDSKTDPQNPKKLACYSFHFNYNGSYQSERVLIMSGAATLKPTDGSAAIKIKAGDRVIFWHGFACDWEITAPLTKHYAYYDKNGKPEEEFRTNKKKKKKKPKACLP